MLVTSVWQPAAVLNRWGGLRLAAQLRGHAVPGLRI
jgi:hypothetical protein